jgi:hypothetical protein
MDQLSKSHQREMKTEERRHIDKFNTQISALKKQSEKDHDKHKKELKKQTADLKDDMKSSEAQHGQVVDR